jgi:hypothetical protein
MLRLQAPFRPLAQRSPPRVRQTNVTVHIGDLLDSVFSAAASADLRKRLAGGCESSKCVYPERERVTHAAKALGSPIGKAGPRIDNAVWPNSDRSWCRGPK